ncbi:hypothetical protein LTR36_002768 [Oleoguttula mirabilis]|uniref:WD40 repeat-like protein n=1 Tax=Oleoguttula mirabilis TaxID=1507867 RepID=A0AAV9JKB5_9PEZI|nr:hypothetical protein LTR36_002768 [Oleoguttula mirabilis]
MKDTLATKLYHRELTDPAVRSRSYHSLYGDRSLIANLDIVNELSGHSGCVNALSWSKSGQLLASGSDDQHLNIHTYQPASTTNQFQLTTTVATGHTANIFSVKFMPHHNDRTVITAAGDGEVRIFDLEYAGQTREASAASGIASESRRRGRNTLYNGVRYLSDGDTDCRVYRSHGNRVKRIVTESSPHLFLTCSEDGEVRQWDLRQPSSAYPAPRDVGYGTGSDSSVPPPLISYKRYNLDLNTISCSPSQPHYIALGGAHLHAFLHDRRMTGRDKLREAGKLLSSPGVSRRTADEEELMSQATQCVRKFAPQGQQRMKRTENGHITACKISDARPDEMVVSWSGDHIYSFDLVRSPDAGEEAQQKRGGGSLRKGSGSRVKESRDRKRKRKVTGSSTSLGGDGAIRGSSRLSTEGTGSGSGEGAALRVRYQNGQSEDIPISHTPRSRALPNLQSLTAKEREAQAMATSTVNIRSALFGPPEEVEEGEGSEPTHRFATALREASATLPVLDQLMRNWRYPMDPTAEMVVAEQTLRRHRESVWRFAQGAGTLARVLGGSAGTMQRSADSSSLRPPQEPLPINLAQLATIDARSNDLPLPQQEHFGYDFIKAIILWLESGIGQLIEGFTRPAEMSASSKAARRLPIPEADAGTEAVEEILMPYLLGLASDRKAVVDVGVNRFEVEENRRVFGSEREAVLAFAGAVGVPFADLSSDAGGALGGEGGESGEVQDRRAAVEFWGLKVGRGVLLNAGEGVEFAFVDRAFGGCGREVLAEERGLLNGYLDADVEAGEDSEAVESVEMMDEDGEATDGATAEDVAAAMREAREHARSGAEDRSMTDEGSETSAGLLEEEEEEEARARLHALETNADDGSEELLYYDEDEQGDEDMDDNDNNNDDDDDDDNDTDIPAEDQDSDTSSSPSDLSGGGGGSGYPRFLFTSSAFERRRHRERIEDNVPCHPATRSYRGHCNIRTVKDVNYLGLDDEYVTSGSDDGNFFIWDRKTGELVNVLHGDDEVVNVVQGHPYETMMAVSGIDHTVKIFSADGRAREGARLGVAGSGGRESSEVAWPHRFGSGSRLSRQSEGPRGSRESGTPGGGGPTAASPSASAAAGAPTREDAPEGENDDDDDENEDYVAENGLASRKRMHDAYRITHANDVERQGGSNGRGASSATAYLTARDLHPLLLLLARGGGGFGDLIG